MPELVPGERSDLEAAYFEFEALWKKYLEYLEEVDYPFELQDKAKPKEIKEFAEIKGAQTMHLRQGRETFLEHLFINMPMRKKKE